MSEALIRDHSERVAELAFSLFRGLGEAEAKRRLPGVLESLSAFARAMAPLAEEPGEAEAYQRAARMGFKVRASELGFMGARQPTTLGEACRRGRLHDALQVLDGVPSAAARGYLARLGTDPEAVAARCGRVWIVPGALDWAGSEDRGKTVIAVETRDFDGETTVGLVVWPVAEPARYFVAAGEPHPLGLAHLRRETDAPVRVHRTPEKWLAAAGDGVVVITERDGSLLSRAKWIVAEDREHARDLARLVCPFMDVRQILLPEDAR